jgi:site-specific recombinase XerD
MDSIPRLRPHAKHWLLDSALNPYIDGYVAYLNRNRFAARTAQQHLAGVAHFAQWMTQSGLTLTRIDESAVTRFLDKHLPQCDCRTPAERNRTHLRAACGYLLQVLRDCGAIPMPALAIGAIADEIRNFDAHMSNAQGLADATRQNYIWVVQRFLVAEFGKRSVVISRLQPADVRKFIADELDLRGTKSNAIALAAGLRAYFRYRVTLGDQVHGLVGVIGSPARWSLASLPRCLSADEIDRLLDAFPSTLPSRRRGYAMVRCALDLGLRTGEIANLALTDIDWSNGTITVRRNKSRREDILPMPATTGQAIVDYLQFERPPTASPAVFTRRLPPHDVPVSSYAVHRLIRDAYHRIGLDHGRVHALRHTLASRMLEHGSSLKEVADVLRHRSLNTTLIYAKLDSRNLLAVALPWPGSRA